MPYYHYDSYNPPPSDSLKSRPLTIFLIVANVLIFVVFNIFLYENGYDFIPYGTNYWQRILNYGEYYRLFTSIFLHADINHLMNNMLILFVIGGQYEETAGKRRFLMIYFIGGLLASLASMFYNMFLEMNVVSLGASGAIFALVGGAIAVVVKDKEVLRSLSKSRLIAFTGFSIYAGLRDTQVDNPAHIGGLFAGFLIGSLISARRNGRL